MVRLLLVVVILRMTANTAEAAHVPKDVAEIVQKWLVETKAPGLSLAAVNRDGLLWSGGFGFADVEAQRPATGTTRYQFASVTKVYTALLLAQLVTEGKVDLDAPLTRYLPEFQPRYAQPGIRPITLRDVALHTAGFTCNMAGLRASGRGHCYTLNELLDWLRTGGLTALPGVQFKYSNFGYALLGAALERAAKKDYKALLQERVLAPLELTATGFAELQSHPEMATPYVEQEGKLTRATNPMWDFAAQAPASEIISTVEDVARFLHAHLSEADPEVIPPAVKALLFTPLFPLDGPAARGPGWTYSWGDGVPRWTHGGGWIGFHSLVTLRPDVGIGLAIATNSPIKAEELGLLSLPILKLLSAYADTTSLDAVAGDYEGPKGFVARVRRTPEATLTIEVRGAVAMVPWGRDTYLIIGGVNKGEWVRFVTEGGQQVLLWEHRRLVRRAAP